MCKAAEALRYTETLVMYDLCCERVCAAFLYKVSEWNKRQRGRQRRLSVIQKLLCCTICAVSEYVQRFPTK